jgi:hypothetical protein
MNQFAKDVRAEASKRASEWLLARIGALLVAVSPTLTLWASHLSLSDSQVSSIRYWMLFVGSIALISCAVSLFLRTFRRLQSVEEQLRVSLARPHKVSDDYEHLHNRGFWVHKQTGQRVCGSCILSEIASPLTVYAIKNSFGQYTRRAWICGRVDCETEYFFKEGDV